MNSTTILPDIYFANDIPISLLIFSGEKLLFAMPPEECELTFLSPERTTMYGEVKDGWISTKVVKPRKIFGISDSDYNSLIKNKDITLVEWDSKEIEHRWDPWDGFRETPSDILSTNMCTYFKLDSFPNDEICKDELARFTWAKLLAHPDFDFDKCTHNTFKWGDNPKILAHQEMVNDTIINKIYSIAVNNYNTLTIADAIDIRNNYISYLSPFWRTISRLKSLCFSHFNESSRSEEIIIHADEVISNTLGASLEQWSEELDNECAKYLNISSTKTKWGKILINFLDGIINTNIPKLASIIFDVPTPCSTPSQLVASDYDKTIEFIHHIRTKSASKQ